MLPLLASAVIVIAGMLLMADRARRDADRARQAQVVMEHISAISERFDAITWRSLATLDDAAPQAVVAQGVQAYRDMTSALRQLRRLGVPRARIAAIERPLGATYGIGIQTTVLSRRDPAASQRMARTEFSPTLERLNAAVAAAGRQQGINARAAQRRTWLGWVGSLVVGLPMLALLAWRLHHMRRRSAVAEQARSVERRGEQHLRAVVRHSSDVVSLIDASSSVRWIAESVRGMLGYEPEELVGRHLTELVHPDEAHRVVRFLHDAAEQEGRVGRLSLRLRAADGDYRQLEAIADNRLGDTEIAGIVLNLRDVTERLALEEQLRHQAFHDSLTGLANRALFEDRLTRALVRVRRHGGHAAVLFIDLDDFKTVNDSLGHGVGDGLLRTASSRLTDVLRAQDTAARLGGDEFAVLLEDLDEPGEASEVAERVRRALEVPLTMEDRRLQSSASIGIAWADRDTTAEELLGNADVAMYAAKERGKAQVARFEPVMRERVLERLNLTGELGSALENGELLLQYQPVVELDTGRISGVEALIRWEHPVRGRLAPDRFIALAESTSLIVPIGRWVLETACAQLRRWDDLGTSAGGLEMSVNVSTRQLADLGFPGDVRAVLERTAIAADRLTLEITEHVLLEDSEEMQRQLRALKEIGVRLAVDDFGTGYSALSYLQSFPIDILKIDRSFVSGIDHDSEKARLVQGIVEMGRNLQLRVITEGIEEAGEAALLRDFRSEYGQGFLFSRPVDPPAIVALLAGDMPAPLILDPKAA
jgi:diguanylate cyclase (GGDEF)-like protein/PAS domain S-box-containing protein